MHVIQKTYHLLIYLKCSFMLSYYSHGLKNKNWSEIPSLKYRTRWIILQVIIISVHSTDINQTTLSKVELAQTLWNKQWAIQFQWLDYSTSEGKIFYKICKEKGGRSVYANVRSKNFKVSVFTDHSRSNEHHKLAWTYIVGENTMAKIIFTG